MHITFSPTKKKNRNFEIEDSRRTNYPYPIRVELVLELLLLLLGPALHGLAPSDVHGVIGSQPPIDLVHNFPEQLRVLSLLDLVERHAQRLQLHRRVVAAAVVGDEEEAGDLGAAGVEAGVRLDVELVAADDQPPAPLLAAAVAAVGVDFVDHGIGGFVVRVHVGRGGEGDEREGKEVKP